jgi:hypothetical protein
MIVALTIGDSAHYHDITALALVGSHPFYHKGRYGPIADRDETVAAVERFKVCEWNTKTLGRTDVGAP